MLGTLCLERTISGIKCYTKQSGPERTWDSLAIESLDSRRIAISRGTWKHLLGKLPGVCFTSIRESLTLTSVAVLELILQSCAHRLLTGQSDNVRLQETT